MSSITKKKKFMSRISQEKLVCFRFILNVDSMVRELNLDYIIYFLNFFVYHFCAHIFPVTKLDKMYLWSLKNIFCVILVFQVQFTTFCS
mgnify:CR=1 FL=1